MRYAKVVMACCVHTLVESGESTPSRHMQMTTSLTQHDDALRAWIEQVVRPCRCLHRRFHRCLHRCRCACGGCGLCSRCGSPVGAAPRPARAVVLPAPELVPAAVRPVASGGRSRRSVPCWRTLSAGAPHRPSSSARAWRRAGVALIPWSASRRFRLAPRRIAHHSDCKLIGLHSLRSAGYSKKLVRPFAN